MQEDGTDINTVLVLNSQKIKKIVMSLIFDVFHFRVFLDERSGELSILG